VWQFFWPLSVFLRMIDSACLTSFVITEQIYAFGSSFMGTAFQHPNLPPHQLQNPNPHSCLSHPSIHRLCRPRWHLGPSEMDKHQIDSMGQPFGPENIAATLEMQRNNYLSIDEALPPRRKNGILWHGRIYRMLNRYLQK